MSKAPFGYTASGNVRRRPTKNQLKARDTLVLLVGANIIADALENPDELTRAVKTVGRMYDGIMGSLLGDSAEWSKASERRH